MKAIVIRDFGGPEVLLYEDVSRPVPGPGEVLIESHAVSVNRTLDLWVRQDGSGLEVKFPLILGVDTAGTLADFGDGVSGFSLGERVTSILPQGLRELPLGGTGRDGDETLYTMSGGYAQYVIAPADRTYHVPDALSYAEATAVSRHFPMAYSICRAAELVAGEWVLVMGAAGALGACAVQIAKHQGAKVIAAAGADERVQTALDLGADHGINYRASDLAAEVMRMTEGKGVSVVLENIADPTLWPGSFGSMGRGGRMVTVGAHGGGVVQLDVKALYRNWLSIRSGLGSGEPGDAAEALELAADGVYSVAINSVMPLSAVAEAHRIAEEPTVLGKVVMDPSLV
jgi:NADPH:quinone reductase-like Zn-dependent oxidoreductase